MVNDPISISINEFEGETNPIVELIAQPKLGEIPEEGTAQTIGNHYTVFNAPQQFNFPLAEDPEYPDRADMVVSENHIENVFTPYDVQSNLISSDSYLVVAYDGCKGFPYKKKSYVPGSYPFVETDGNAISGNLYDITGAIILIAPQLNESDIPSPGGFNRVSDRRTVYRLNNTGDLTVNPAELNHGLDWYILAGYTGYDETPDNFSPTLVGERRIQASDLRVIGTITDTAQRPLSFSILDNLNYPSTADSFSTSVNGGSFDVTGQIRTANPKDAVLDVEYHESPIISYNLDYGEDKTIDFGSLNMALFNTEWSRTFTSNNTISVRALSEIEIIQFAFEITNMGKNSTTNKDGNTIYTEDHVRIYYGDSADSRSNKEQLIHVDGRNDGSSASNNDFQTPVSYNGANGELVVYYNSGTSSDTTVRLTNPGEL